MMENRPPLTSPDGASSRNSPERCPSPLYSWNSMRQRHKILRCYQYKRLKHIKTEVKEEAQETYLRGDELCKKEERSPEISTDTRDSRDTQRVVKAEKEKEEHVRIKKEKIPPETNTNPGDTRDTERKIKAEEKEEGNLKIKEEKIATEISTEPGDTRDTQGDIKPKEDRENLNIKKKEISPEIGTVDSNGDRSFTDPGGNRAAETNIKAENEERRVKAKRNILEIGMDGRYRWYNTEKHPGREIVDDDITAYVAKEKARTENLLPVRHKEEKPYPCPECGKRFTLEKYLIVHYRCHSGERPFFCAECGKSFSYRSSRDKHKVTHTTVGAFPCPECGKRFRAGWILAAHVRVHSSENGHR